MLYGVRTNDEGKQYQAVCTRGEMILPNTASTNALAKLEKDLVNAKQNGAYQNTEYRVQELQEWDIKPTNLDKPASDTGDLPFDAPSADNGGMPWD